jgi:drug/metabolite transporter (DMT)-like permease
MNTNLARGIKFALATALISGLANFFNKEIIISGINPVLLTALKNGLVGLALLAIVLPLFKTQKLEKKDWLKFCLIALIGGSFSFILFFKGLAISTAIKGSFIQKTIFIWTALMSLLFLKEKFNKYQFAGLMIMAASFLPLIKFNILVFGKGELMIFAATLLWSVEVILAKKFLANIDYRFLITARMALGALIIFIFAFFSNSLTGITALTGLDWLKIFIVSAFLFGYVSTWYKALSLAPASLVTSILTLAFPITIIASDLRIFSLPKLPDILSIFLLAAGAIIFIHQFLNKTAISYRFKKQ